MNAKIEKIKTLVLWLLFISSIALVAIRYNLISHMNFFGSSMSGFSARYMEEKILPQHINIRFDTYDMTSLLTDKDEFYKSLKKELYIVLDSRASAKKVEQKEYEDVKSALNVLAIYDDIPSVLLEKSLKLRKSVISNIGYVREICVLPKKNYIYIKTTDNYYKITSEHRIDSKITDSIKSTIYTKFYTKFDNINKNSNLLLPLTFDMSMNTISVYNLSDSIKANDIARNIFEDRIDFTSSMIQKDGVYFYSYNNGQEILKLYQDTLLEYKKESVENLQDDIEKSTTAMLNFINGIGMHDVDTVIKSVEKIKKGSKIVYKFNIARQRHGVFISMSDEEENIQVIGDTVIYARVYLAGVSDDIESIKIVEPAKALNDNIDYIKNILKNSDVFSAISKIDEISLIYKKYDNMLLPTWVYFIDNFVFYIDGQSGEIKSYAVEKD